MSIDPLAGDWPFDEAAAFAGETLAGEAEAPPPDEPLFDDGENWEDGWE